MNQRGRSASPSRMQARGRSSSPSRMTAPATRSRSTDPATRNQVRGRSSSPSQKRGRSNSPGGRSQDGRSASAEGRKDAENSNAGGKGFRKGGKRKEPKAEGEGGDRKSRRRRTLHKGRKVLAKAPRAIAKAPKRLGKGIAKAPKRLGKGIKRGSMHIKQRIAPNQECPMWKVMSYVIPIVIIIGCAIGLISATGSKDKFTPTFVSDLIPRLDGKDVVDPFAGGGVSGGGTTSIPKWNNGGTMAGLSLTILNAMSDDWAKFFDLVISDYEFGDPDTLTLSTEKAEEDKECTAVAGKIKICNGDYGETKWRGINEVTFDTGGFIAASTARMNEFYLLNDVDDAKQYTLCHELGHGFGLAHTDENFDNEDLGNCMDYSDNFAVNKHPDASNYEYLAGLYGTVGGGNSSTVGGRRLRGWLSGTRTVHTTSVWNKMHEAAKQLAARKDDDNDNNNAHNDEDDGWILLHRNEHGESHELEFEEGYKVRVHMLLANKKGT